LREVFGGSAGRVRSPAREAAVLPEDRGCGLIGRHSAAIAQPPPVRRNRKRKPRISIT